MNGGDDWPLTPQPATCGGRSAAIDWPPRKDPRDRDIPDARILHTIAVLDVVDDGLTYDEIAARTASWLDEIRSAPPLRLREAAVDALDLLAADGDL